MLPQFAKVLLTDMFANVHLVKLEIQLEQVVRVLARVPVTNNVLHLRSVRMVVVSTPVIMPVEPTANVKSLEGTLPALVWEDLKDLATRDVFV